MLWQLQDLIAKKEPLALDPTTFANLQFFEQFAAASYCEADIDVSNGGTKVTCAAGNCPLVQADAVTTVYEFQNSGVTGVTGYLAVDHTLGLTVLAFRGTHTIRNWAADFDAVLVPTDICSECFCHQGFYDSWRDSRTGILAALANTTTTYPTNQLIITGHSLGGAIATIAAAEIRKSTAHPADLYTYGAPRIAGTVLSSYITNQNLGGNYRVTHYDDPVPRLPPLSPGPLQDTGYVHISPEYYIATANGVVPGAGDVSVFQGAVNFGGNTGNDQNKTDVAAHLWYFNAVSACKSPRGFV
ncbi:Lip3 precursor [Usnea florida]